MEMLFSGLQSLPWQLTCLLFATVATAQQVTITPSNTTADTRWFKGTLSLRHVETDRQTQMAELVPLTRQAARQTIEGNLFNTNFSTVTNLSSSEIAYISCNPNDYTTDFADAQRVFQVAYQQGNISGVILYSTADDFCRLGLSNDQGIMQEFSVHSMTNRTASAALRDAIDNLPINLKYSVQVLGRGDDGNNTGTGGFSQQPQNPLGPSPSTAVAMIILYSITGIITALFLVIIVTGAVRAHRHPDRYGPRNVLGRPRQSRARGLGRAILDTIPIVKFGEKEPEKPTDVELASTTATRQDANVASDADNRTGQGTTETNNAYQTNDSNTTRHTTTASMQEHQEGIAPAQPVAVVVATGSDSASNDESLGCSICTEDFEKGQDLRLLPCDHKFHPECVDPWLLNVSGTCPLCRVDLRPVNTTESFASQDPDDFRPPLNLEADTTAHRHRTAFRDILSLRYRPNATPQERIYYLRRLREQRGRRSDDAAETDADAHGSIDNVTDGRRSVRMSLRLSDVFSGRTRRERSPTQPGESSRSAAQTQPSTDDPPLPNATNRVSDGPA